MWLNNDGLANTVALPNPAEVMTADFRETLEALHRSWGEAVTTLVEDLEDKLLEDGFAGIDGFGEPSAEAAYEGRPPVVGLLSGAVTTLDELRGVLGAVDVRWRLDALMAVGSYLD